MEKVDNRNFQAAISSLYKSDQIAAQTAAEECPAEAGTFTHMLSPQIYKRVLCGFQVTEQKLLM